MFRLVGLIYVLFWGLAIFGWLSNIFQIFFRISDPVTGLFLLKCLGVPLLPLGAILGLIGLF